MRRPALLGPVLAGRVASVAADVAARVVDPARVGAVAPVDGTSYPEVHRWRGSSLALGGAGAALVCSALDAHAPGEGWDRVGHAHLSAGVAELEPEPSLLVGGGAVSAAAAMLSRGGTRYQGLRDDLDGWLLPRISATARRITEAPDVVADDYDLVNGLSGSAALLLTGPGSPARTACLADVTRALAAVVTTWGDRPDHGLAHGLAGPVAALALSRAADPTEPGSAVAVRSGADRLLPANAVDRDTSGSWCTGAAGISRALWLAGTPTHRAAARSTLRFAPPLDSPTFCHGVAGQLLVTALFWWDTGDAEFGEAARALCGYLLEFFDHSSPFGFRDVEAAGTVVDNPGVLCGAGGVALVLLALLADRPPTWTRLFLLS
ncbi:lanthionine synthetase LanC family protein [Longispora sp. NPDC051575]|uniref:lanthionine synthetase LanC family protein n=1 Tax=Longispora sp. NPDC051575 TaxID=3154943 RepID=UPI0034289315